MLMVVLLTRELQCLLSTVLGRGFQLGGQAAGDRIVPSATESGAKPTKVPIAVNGQNRTVVRAHHLDPVVMRQVNAVVFPLLDLAPPDRVNHGPAGVNRASVLESSLDGELVDTAVLHSFLGVAGGRVLGGCGMGGCGHGCGSFEVRVSRLAAGRVRPVAPKAARVPSVIIPPRRGVVVAARCEYGTTYMIFAICSPPRHLQPELCPEQPNDMLSTAIIVAATTAHWVD